MSERKALDRVRRRYAWLAAVYNFDPAERPGFASARARAVELLRLSPGQAVLDVACGTGRNFSMLEKQIGATGRLVGVDATPAMLRKARSRVRRNGWTNVRLLQVDASELSAERLEAAEAPRAGEWFDAAICTLGLSVIPRWEGAWEATLSLVKPGGRIAVMDGGYRAARGGMCGRSILRPVVWIICRLAAADCTREPWLRLARETDDVVDESFAWGYMRVAAGTTRRGVQRLLRSDGS